MTTDTQFTRELRLAREVVDHFSLDLHGMHVATEAATGHFRWTAVLALLAGADRVIAVGKDSRYGSARDACDAVEKLAVRARVAENLEVTTDVSRIANAEIVTNLSGIRPLDAARLSLLRPGTAIPYMCEAWEYRSSDLDLDAAFARDLIVLGTNEHHESLDFMKYVGLLGVKLALECDVAIHHSQIVVVGGGIFGRSLSRALRANGATVGVVCPIEERHDFGSSWLGVDLSGNQARAALGRADLLLFGDYTTSTQHVGDGGLAAREIAATNPSLCVAHISGMIDATACREAGLRVVPDVVATAPRTMSVTTGYLGIRPVLELHAAGLKVGEICAQAWREARGDAVVAREIALTNALCQEFPDEVLDAHVRPEQQRRFDADTTRRHVA